MKIMAKITVATLYLIVFLVLAYFTYGEYKDFISRQRDTRCAQCGNDIWMMIRASGLSAKHYTGRFMNLTTYGLTGRIVNGTKAVSMQFPHQVSLKRSWSEGHFCGGSIISDKLVLTAGHCMYLRDSIIEPWTILVVAGEMRLTDITPAGQRRNVKVITLHPRFNNITLQNDVAILELSIPFAMTPEVRSAALPTSDVTPKALCVVSGWGYQSANIPIVSNDLMYVELPIREPRECRELLINITTIYPGMYCAGFLKGGKDACQGDSGGGMVCNGILTGVVSGGQGCALPKFPGVYSNVFYYKDWIESTIGQNINNIKEQKEDGPNSCARKTPRIMAVVSFFVLLIMIN
ncbi:trypsin-like isoform X2 [Odontomachus brunneus]|uniref:trypsin-like isoform X2 n=1 Tax=Odontomachus brunneus TaxID=486640 RepID=UPI0013F22BFA|nr:trypsin-like isoform X2 [Odontomachus brunneus]